MHATVSGCGDNLAVDDADAIEQAKAYFTYFPSIWRDEPPALRGRGAGPAVRPPTSCPAEEHAGATTCTT